MRWPWPLLLVLGCSDAEPAEVVAAGDGDRIVRLEERIALLEGRVAGVEREVELLPKYPPPDNEPEPLPLAPGPAPPIAAPAPPESKPGPTPAGKVTFYIRTPGVSAQILDARDQAVYGVTNVPGGVFIDRGDRPVEIILRAAGYHDLVFSTVPNRDKVIVKDLKSG